MGSKILMIEHDSDDRWLTEETFQAEGFPNGIEFIHEAELPAYLRGPGHRPALIMLSLHTRLAEGLEMIKDIRRTEGYDKVPVVVLSENSLPSNVAACYAAGATSFIQKPAMYSDTLFKIKSFINYWFRTVELPA